MAGKTYFIADTHFGHGAIIRYENRPFKDTKEQEEVLLLVKQSELFLM